MPDSWHVRKPNPGVSARPRFQSTAQMAMAETASSYDCLPNESERRKALYDRKVGLVHPLKCWLSLSSSILTIHDPPHELHRATQIQIANTTTNIVFGSDAPLFESTLKSKPGPDRTWVEYPGGKLSPAEMKRKLSSANWHFGDSARDWTLAGTIEAPEANVLQYRGVLRKDVQDMIASSSLHFGSAKHDFKTTARDTTILKANDIDYAGDHKRAMEMKKALTASSINLSSDAGRGVEDFVSTTHRR